MKNALKILFLSLCVGWGCNQPSTQKVRDVQDFSFSIDLFSFADESGITTNVTPTSITEIQNQRGKEDSVTVKLTSDQTAQIKNALNRLPLDKLQPKYEQKGITDGGGRRFMFVLDKKKYEVSYVNHPLDANLEELVTIIEKILPAKK